MIALVSRKKTLQLSFVSWLTISKNSFVTCGQMRTFFVSSESLGWRFKIPSLFAFTKKLSGNCTTWPFWSCFRCVRIQQSILVINIYLLILFNNAKYTCNWTHFSVSPNLHSCTGLENLLLPPRQLINVTSLQWPRNLLGQNLPECGQQPKFQQYCFNYFHAVDPVVLP